MRRYIERLMRKLMIILVVSLLMVFSLAKAAADQNSDKQSFSWYVQGEGGPAYTHSIYAVNPISDSGVQLDYKLGYNAVGHFGLKYKHWRTDAGIGYINNSLNKANENNASGRTHRYSYMLNGYYDIPLGAKLHHYLGIGVGAVTTDAKVNSASYNGDSNHTNFAYQVTLGFGYDIKKNIMMFGQYVRQQVQNETWDGGYKSTSTLGRFNVGLRYYFA